jgi:AMP-activated protein kinase-like protein
MAGSRDMDPRLNAYLDGELSASEAAEFEGELRPGSVSRNQLDTLLHLGAWFRTTRPRAPANLADSVEQILREDAARKVVVLRRQPSFVRWAWVPVAAAAAFALFLIVPGRHTSSTSDPIQSASRTPPPAIQTSRTAVTGIREPNTVRYRFTVKADQVREICLAGDFNQWKVCDAPLLRVAEGVWSITIDLPRGRHEYMFVIDGRWVTDPNAMGYSTDGFGNRNALLVV